MRPWASGVESASCLRVGQEAHLGLGSEQRAFPRGDVGGCLQIPFLQFFQEEIYNVGGGGLSPPRGWG